MTSAVEMVGDRTIFDEPHHQSLEILAAKALAAGDAVAAFKLADRRCRVLPSPEAHCYVMRAEASYSLGAPQAAIADLLKALDVAPDDIPANRRMLAWGNRTQQLQAALRLTRYDSDPKSIRNAAQVLIDNGQQSFANVTVLDEVIEGWAVWQSASSLTISIANEHKEITQDFQADVFHVLAPYGSATNFCFRRPRSSSPQMILLSAGGHVFYSARTAGNENAPSTALTRSPQPIGNRHRITVIVPIYADFAATRLCLETLLDALKGSDHRVILINDATPEPAIAALLVRLSTTEPRVELMVNTRNVGFVGSVNRALDRIKEGDVILLNSDTLVPGNFAARLASAARSSTDIGTVTPLSNNGEYTSFPIPFRPNPLGTRQAVERLDAIAAKANAGTVVDIPSGIGFCLYITRACLDRIGSLSEHFERGYLEDVDFCLRAREQGFRNVCASFVYVGHAGSKSFGAEKRALVVRNFHLLERRFPQYRPESVAFVNADPLKSIRQAIEIKAAAVGRHSILLVTGAGAVGTVAKQRACDIDAAPTPVLILEVRCQPLGAVVGVVDAAGAMPQSLEFYLAHSNEQRSLLDFLDSYCPSRIYFFDPVHTPPALIALLLKLKIPYDLFIADAGLLEHGDPRFSAASAHGGARSAATMAGEKTASAATRARWRKKWRRIAAGAERILVPSPDAEAFAATILPERDIDQRFSKAQRRPKQRRAREKTFPHLGFVPVRMSAAEQRLMRDTARHLRTARPDVALTVLGATPDDIGLMRGSGAFVTGAIEPAEFADVVDALGIDHLFISMTEPIFGHPILQQAASLRLPTASFDWCGGRNRRRQDLRLGPSLSLDAITRALCNWLPLPSSLAMDDRR
jgi:O-antigen biosynthesis protein